MVIEFGSTDEETRFVDGAGADLSNGDAITCTISCYSGTYTCTFGFPRTVNFAFGTGFVSGSSTCVTGTSNFVTLDNHRVRYYAGSTGSGSE